MSSEFETISRFKIVPVVAIENADDANRLADALIAGGLPCAEITLRTEAGIAVIRSLSKRNDFFVGAGTVHNAKQAEQVTEAGAKFVVSPGFNPTTVRWCLQHNVAIVPGVSSPTDLEMALEAGVTFVKFFPAEALGGTVMLRALSAPYGDVRFMPTGGIRPDNLAAYLQLPQVFACGGSWMVKSEWIREGRFDEVTSATAAAVRLANEHLSTE